MLGAVYRERMRIRIVRMHIHSRGTAPKKRVNVHSVPSEPEAEGALEKPQAVSRVFFRGFYAKLSICQQQAQTVSSSPRCRGEQQ